MNIGDKQLTCMQAILQDLSDIDGSIWKESHGEIHATFNEMVFWILLYEDSDLAKVHKVFGDIIKPYVDTMQPLQIALIYKQYMGLNELRSTLIMGNDAVFSASNNHQRHNLNLTPEQAQSTIFEANDSKRNN